MKLFKKILCPVLLAAGLTLSFEAIPASAAPLNVPSACCNYHGRYMHFSRWETGNVYINYNNHTIYNSSITPLAGDYNMVNYLPKESFNYDSVYRYYNCKTQTDYYFASYTASNGARRFVMTSYDNGLGKRYVPGVSVS